MIFINGKEADFAGVTVTECLKKLNYSTDRIAIEFNGDILPRRSTATPCFPTATK